MATADNPIELTVGQGNGNDNGTNLANPLDEVNTVTTASIAEECLTKWGFELEQLYKMALKFCRDNESKVFHPTYDQRNQLAALVAQVKFGHFDETRSPQLGTLDIIGRDRRQSWLNLGKISKEEAMMKVVDLVNEMCLLFKTYIEAHHRDMKEKERLRLIEQRVEMRKLEEKREQESHETEEKRKADEEVTRFESQKRAIQEALNRQTYQQFELYAKQQYPNSPEQQVILIGQLQEQHYQQYMQQMLQHQLRNQNQSHSGSSSSAATSSSQTSTKILESSHVKTVTQSSPLLNSQGQSYQPHYQSTAMPILIDKKDQEINNSDDAANGHEIDDQNDNDDCDEYDDDVGPVAPAQMWTRKDIALFKDSIRNEGGDGIIKVGHGEIVTIRVPTHSDGTCIFWEFATDSYDIGFGLLFEWTKNPGNQVSVHISESEDEDDDEDDDEEEIVAHKETNGTSFEDLEKGAHNGPLSVRSKDEPPCSVIIPIYRRDSQEEVYAGNHPYPGQGIYLLKFDNSYSLWRSKNLYYRVYYTR